MRCTNATLPLTIVYNNFQTYVVFTFSMFELNIYDNETGDKITFKLFYVILYHI